MLPTVVIFHKNVLIEASDNIWILEATTLAVNRFKNKLVIVLNYLEKFGTINQGVLHKNLSLFIVTVFRENSLNNFIVIATLAHVLNTIVITED